MLHALTAQSASFRFANGHRLLNPMRHVILFAAAVMSLFVVLLEAAKANEEEVNVYSYRQPFLVKPLFDKFTEETGIRVNVIFAKKGLIERAAQEAGNSPMDVLLTTDIGNLIKAVDNGIAGTVSDEMIESALPSNLRDPNGQWFALTTRARVVYASKERVGAGEPVNYEELAEPKWKGRICTRSGAHPYNVALIASLIAHHGEEKAKAWLENLKANLARKPQGNDRAQVKAVFEGECDLAIGNTYYMGAMMTNEKNPEQKDWAAAVNVVFPNSGDRGTHVNVSGMVMGKHAPNPESALKLMQYLTSQSAQQVYAEVNHEYPARAGVAWSDLVKGWGEFKADDLDLSVIAANRKRALELVNEVGFDS